MDFSTVQQEARTWIKDNGSSFDLFTVDATQKRLDFQMPNNDVTFYVELKDDDDTKWHLWSNNERALLKLQPSIEQVTGNRLTSIADILASCAAQLKDLKHEDNEEEDGDEDDDDVDDGEDDAYYQDGDDYADDMCENVAANKDDSFDLDDEEESFFGAMKTVSTAAIQRLKCDLKNIKKVGPGYGIVAEPRGDNLFLWDVKLTDVPTDCRLGKDLQQYSTKYNQEAALKLEMQFAQDYPYSPPFIRVIRPRFKFLTGHVTIGGSICMEMLTKSGWVPSNDIESILVQVRAEIMSDPNASLDQSRPNESYTEREARDAFDRMVQRYGWNK